MKNIKALFSKDASLHEKPWLIIGKGPSYEAVNEIDLSAYNVLILNHVIRKQKAKISHLLDIDVFEACAEEITAHADYLVMPYYPHVNNEPGRFSLSAWVRKLPALQKLEQQGRLYWYDQLGIKALLKHGLLPVGLHRQIRVSYFSAEAAVEILASNGIKIVHTLGVDGGNRYSPQFEQTCAETLLANGRPSFDDQFKNIIRTISEYKLNFRALGTPYPIKVYVATQEEQMLAVKVLEYSIKKHTTQVVEVFPLHLANIHYPEPKEPKNKQRTPFSFQRFLIPQLNGHEGWAIYLDSDMQLFGDIDRLWTLPMGNHDVLTVVPSKPEKRRLQFSVMLMDCEKLQWNIDNVIKALDDGELSYEDLMYDMKMAKSIGVDIPSIWNCLEWFEKDKSELVHYTDMPLQPWVSRDNKLGHLWVGDLIEAVDSGFIDMDYVMDHVEKGWVRPSLIHQIEHRVLSSLNLPAAIVKLDDAFVAPYKRM